MLLGIPISLGSWWGLLVIAAMIPALIGRLIDEEKFLARNLPGYVEYQKKVRYRLIPLICSSSFKAPIKPRISSATGSSR